MYLDMIIFPKNKVIFVSDLYVKSADAHRAQSRDWGNLHKQKGDVCMTVGQCQSS